ncbi:MAG: tRNA uridine-5-carboxymethylaminomethyl(34) synthesis GTPase MnmE [Candidatus Omnitrophota bacterium]
MNDTIVAIATSSGQAGIGIIRISGKNALTIADKIFLSKNKKVVSTFKTYTTHYGWIVKNHDSSFVVSNSKKINNTNHDSRITNHEIIDEVILTVMRSPRSYTKEDIVEINCHGGIVSQRAILDLVLENGARLAEPGEFTKRAFLNGRIDLAQAEAVLDVIRAKTDNALKVSLEQLKGALSKQINNLGKELLNILSILEASIDFPDEEIDVLSLKIISGRLNKINKELINILDEAKTGRIFREGINVVICGKPNVGKSSLLNALLKRERSIVTPIAGTTRDTIEEIIDIKGIPLKIVDTAGILEPRDLIERKAVTRSKKYITQADLIILMFDASTKLSKEDKILIKKLKKKQVIAIINKIDLKELIEKDKITKLFKNVVSISAKKIKNINLLEDAICDLVYKGKVINYASNLVTNTRHIELLKKVQKFIATSLNSMDNKLSIEFIAQDIKEALLSIDELLGKKFSQDLLDKIFSEFCIGK